MSRAECRCRNLADEHMPPSARIGDAEAKRRGLWSTAECDVHRPAAPAAEAGDELRAEIGAWLVKNLFWGIDYQRGPEAADRLMTEVPALQRLVAEAAEAARLRAVCPACEHTVDSHSGDFCEAAMCYCNETSETLHRVLDGD